MLPTGMALHRKFYQIREWDTERCERLYQKYRLLRLISRRFNAGANPTTDAIADRISLRLLKAIASERDGLQWNTVL